MVECLSVWRRNKLADMKLIAALRGRAISEEDSLQEVLEACVQQGRDSAVHLKRFDAYVSIFLASRYKSQVVNRLLHLCPETRNASSSVSPS